MYRVRVHVLTPPADSEAVRGVAEFSGWYHLQGIHYHIVAAANHIRILRPVEVAIHTILYVRQVYPADLFIRRRKYDTPVFQSRHPGLNEYIAGAVRAITDELALVSHQAPSRRMQLTGLNL